MAVGCPASPRVVAARRFRRRQMRIGAVRDQQPHRLDVARIGGAPERRRADFVDAQHVEVVRAVPDLALQPRVRIRALVEQRLHQVEIRRPLLQIRARLRIERLRRPLHVERRVERRRARIAGQRRSRALLEQVIARSNWPLIVAISSGLVRSAGLT